MKTKTLGFGRFPSGRAIRCNLFLPQAQHKKKFPLLSLTQPAGFRTQGKKVF
jgi:hypothetical protein